MEGIGESLHSNTNWSVPQVGISRLFDRVVIQIDDFVEIFCYDFGDLNKLLEIEPRLTILVQLDVFW